MILIDTPKATDYADIFRQRGHQYHAAMAAAPRARDEEFRQLFARYPCLPAERIIDAPSGGGYLQDYLERSIPGHTLKVSNLEFTPGFCARPIIVEPYAEWPVPQAWASRAICLAASHHINDLDRLLENFHQHTMPGAMIHLADVEPDGGISAFLDTFVNEHNSTGHSGIYRRFSEFRWPEWLNIRSIETRYCPWKFDSEAQLLDFCHNLFGLEESCRPLLHAALERYVGIQETHQGVELQWQLVYVDGQVSI